MSGEQKMYGKAQWLGPESNRLYQHYSLDNLKWKADTDHPRTPDSRAKCLIPESRQILVNFRPKQNRKCRFHEKNSFRSLRNRGKVQSVPTTLPVWGTGIFPNYPGSYHPLPSLIPSFWTSHNSQFSEGNKNKIKNSSETSHGSGLSRTGFVCITPSRTNDGKQMRTIRYRAFLPCSALSVYCGISRANGKK
jgi:hypothetical protein